MSIDLTLDRIRALAGHLPPYTRPTVHIAGTNGKGSVSAFVSSVLGKVSSVGRFNSPHLLSVYDSIVINNVTVDPSTYESARNLVESTSRLHGLSISSFEVLTLTALMVFEQARVDVAVIEVGMGGRLDATNVIPDDCIMVSALTAVDLDHQAFLGSTVGEIAMEKAGIARPGKPFILGYQRHGEVKEAAERAVHAVGGEFLSSPNVRRRSWNESVDGPVPQAFTLTPPWSQPPPSAVECQIRGLAQPILTQLSLRGKHQLHNLGIALGILDALISHSASRSLDMRTKLTAEIISSGVSSSAWPGRLSFHSVGDRIPVLVDGAHNVASSETLAAYLTDILSTLPPSRDVSLTFILALSRSPPKKPIDTLSPLFPLKTIHGVKIDAILLRFSPPDGMPWVQCEDPAAVKDVIQTLAPGTEVTMVDDTGTKGIAKSFEGIDGQDRQENGDHLVVVAGSLYLVADFYRFIGGNM